MRKIRTLDYETAKELFYYNKTTGVLQWRDRPKSKFKTAGQWKFWRARYACAPAGHKHTCTVGKSYIQVRVKGVLHYAHRIVWVLNYGFLEETMEIDHIDGNGINNKIENLRVVTNQENKRNQRLMSSNSSGYTGVSFDKRRGRYEAYITIQSKKISLGSFKTAEEAYAIRCAANKEFGFHENHGTARDL